MESEKTKSRKKNFEEAYVGGPTTGSREGKPKWGS